MCGVGVRVRRALARGASESSLHHYARFGDLCRAGGRVVGRRTQLNEGGPGRGAGQGRVSAVASRGRFRPARCTQAAAGTAVHVRRAREDGAERETRTVVQVRTLVPSRSFARRVRARLQRGSACAIARPRTTRDVVEIYIYNMRSICVQNYHSAAMSAHTYHMRTSDLLSS